MRRLPLYSEVDKCTLVDTVEPLPTDKMCDRCPGHKGAASGKRCLPPLYTGEGDLDVLVVADSPTKEESSDVMPFGSVGSAFAFDVIQKARGDLKIGYTYAFRCPLPTTLRKDGLTKMTKAYVAAEENCAQYLAQVILDRRPKRIITLGSNASNMVAGFKTNLDIRRGYGFLVDKTPVFVMPPLWAIVKKNRAREEWLRRDLQWALRAPIPEPELWDSSALLVQTPEDAEQAVAWIKELLGQSTGKPWFAYDCETGGRLYTDAFRITSLAIGVGADLSNVFVWTFRALRDSICLKFLRELMESPAFWKVGHNIKYDINSVRSAYDWRVSSVYLDTNNSRRLMKAGASAALEHCAQLVGCGGHKKEAKAAVARAVKMLTQYKTRYRKFEADPEKHDIPTIPPTPDLDDLPVVWEVFEDARLLDEKPRTHAYAIACYYEPDVMDRYCALDTATTALLGRINPEQMRRRGVRRIDKAIVIPAIDSFSAIEARGLGADRQKMRHLATILKRGIEETTDSIQTLLNERLEKDPKLQDLVKDRAFNFKSKDDVRWILFTAFGLKPPPGTTTAKTGVQSVAGGVLEKIRHPICGHVREYNRLEKLLGGYAIGMEKFIFEDGRIHPEYNITGTSTGRISLKNPNLMTIPAAETEEGTALRRSFVAEPGKVLLVADYSQMELRVAAMLSGDPILIAAYKEGLDLHMKTAEITCKARWGLSVAEFHALDPAEKAQKRQDSKPLIFGPLYGKTAWGLSKDMGWSVEKAQAVLDAVLGGYKVLNQWILAQRKLVKVKGEVWTWWDGHPGRVRPLPGVMDYDISTMGKRRFKPTPMAITHSNSAVNMPVQGTGSEYCIASINEMHKRGAPMVLTVHDSIAIEIPDNPTSIATNRDMMSEVMLGWPTLHGVPLEIEFKIGPSWGDLEKMK